MATQEEQKHPANAVFLLLEDRKFRFSVVKPGLEKEKQRLGRLVTGKHQVRGFRNIAKAPVSMLLPVIADEASVAPELAQVLLEHWYAANPELKDKVAAKLKEFGYEPSTDTFDEQGNIGWKLMTTEHANQQFDGEFLPGEDENSVMLMSLMLGWFGTDEEEPETAPPAKEEKPKAKPAAKAKKSETRKPEAEKKPAPKKKTQPAKLDATAAKAKKSTPTKKTTPKSKSK